MEVLEARKKTCFVIMPIADAPGYAPGHFTRVYEYIIKPACFNAGFEPLRADDVKNTNDIAIDILRKIIESDMAVCDLSSRNPNVMYELGIRHSFGLPVTLIKDQATGRSFDIQGLRDLPYDESLRIDTVKKAISELTTALKNTYEAPKEDVNSLIQLLGIQPAKITNEVQLTNETSILLNAINSLSRRIDSIEENESIFRANNNAPKSFKNRNFVSQYEVGDTVTHPIFGLGEVIIVTNDGEIAVNFRDNGDLMIPKSGLVDLKKLTKKELLSLKQDEKLNELINN